MKKKLKYWVKANDLDELYDLAKEKQKELWVGADPYRDLYDQVYIKHQDNSKFRLQFCFIRWGIYGKGKYKSEILIVITEHNGILLFHLSDLEYIKIRDVPKDKKKKVLEIVMPKNGKGSTYKIYE